MAKKTILLTGASGSMGGEAFEELRRRRDAYDTVLLLRPSKVNQKTFLRHAPNLCETLHPSIGATEGDGLRIVWGELQDYHAVLEAVTGCDVVLHPAAIIEPAAYDHPQLTKEVNYGGMLNLIRAIQAQPGGAEEIKFVSVSSVATYGSRLPPMHRVRVGDPMMPNPFNCYSVSKVAAERALIESGIRHWASLRAGFIAIPDALSLMASIMFHPSVVTRMEMMTARDSGYGLVQAIECPEEFWGYAYDFGGGPDCRVIYTEYLDRVMQLLGMGDYREIMERNWFATRGFNGGWFEDSNVLNGYLGHWRETAEDHYRQVLKAAPWYVHLGRFAPKNPIKLYMKTMADPLRWASEPAKFEKRITAFLGSLEAWGAIPDWEHEEPMDPSIATGRLLDHGFEAPEGTHYAQECLENAAQFRGGQFLSGAGLEETETGKWSCSRGHAFEASPKLILHAGHWCPECEAPPFDYDEIAKTNPFLAQAHYNGHSRDEHNFYPESCYDDPR